jgi:hypothetical protein
MDGRNTNRPVRYHGRIGFTSHERELLKKLVHRPLHSCRDESERDAELDAAAYESAPLNARSVLVFDDLITRGATLSRIAEAITASTPGAKVYGVALGKTEKRAYIPAIYDDYVPNDHVPQEWNSLWEQGEERYRERNKG